MIANKKKVSVDLELVIVNVFWCFLCIVLVSPVYDNSDDHLMNVFLFGGKGFSSSDIVFVNIILSKILYFLDKMFPIVNWMTALETSLTAIFFIVTSSLIKKSSSSKIFAYIYIGLVAPYFYTHITFSVAAMLGGFAGILVIFKAIEAKDTSKYYIILGMSILFVSTMLREMAITGTILFWLIPGIECLYHYRKDINILLKRCIRISLVIGCGLVFLKAVNQYYYENWDLHYTKINSARAAVSDYPLADWEEVKTELENIGVTENDYSLIKEKLFDDYEYFNADLLSEISNIYETKIREDKLENSVLDIYTERQIWCTVWAITLFLIIIMLEEKEKLKFFLGKLILIWFCFAIYTIYLEYVVGRLPRYVKDGFCGIVVALTVFEFSKHFNQIQIKGYRKILAVIILSLIVSAHTNFEWVWNAINHTTYKRQEYREFFSEISQREDEFYFADMVDYFSEIYMRAFSVYEPIEPGIYNNFFRLSIWDREHPVTNKQLSEHGMSNPFEDIVKDNVYFMSDTQSTHYKLLEKYYEEHFKTDISYSLVEEFPEYGGIQIFKFQRNYDKCSESAVGSAAIESVEYKGDDNSWISLNLTLSGYDDFVENAYIYFESKNREKESTFMCNRNIWIDGSGVKLKCVFPYDEIVDIVNTDNYKVALLVEGKNGDIIQISNNLKIDLNVKG